MIWSPLEQFEVLSLISINLGLFSNIHISLTNLGLYTIITVFLVLSLHFIGFNNFQIIPSRWTISLESAFASVHGLCKAQIGKENEIYLPFIYSLFFFLLISNLNGNIPYGFTITTSLVVSIGLSVAIFLGVTILGLVQNKIHFFSFFLPSGTPLALVALLVPIEVISYVSRAFSLGIRLFANITSGHVLIKILSGFLWPIFTGGLVIGVVTLIPFAIFLGIVGLEIAVSFIQAYVFTILTSRYIKDALELH
ncbi:UNVERIFIED_CONTAM: ATP synthase subunit a [Trichonephila clavipes]